MAGRRAKPRPQHRRRRLVAIVVGLVVVAALAVGAALVIPAIAERFAGPEDYPGPGTGEVTVRIEPGQTGTDVAGTLVEHDVVASAEAFTDLLVDDPSIQLHPGAYRLQQQMSAQGALDALLDPDSRAELRVTIPEGFMLPEVFARLERDTGIPASEFLQASGDLTQFDVPSDALSLEGWLFPATYTFDDGATAVEMLQAMIARQQQALDEAGVPEADRTRVLTLASLIQREAGPAENFPRVSRVFQNRLDIGMLLQSDATVAYGTGNTDRVTTTEEERADASNPYNTYVHPGLPAGPISAPGDAAIDAALHPADGDWLFFVTVNLETGETVFSETHAEHEVAVAQWQQWMREHPDWQG